MIHFRDGIYVNNTWLKEILMYFVTNFFSAEDSIDVGLVYSKVYMVEYNSNFSSLVPSNRERIEKY